MELKNITGIKAKMQTDISTLTKVIASCSQEAVRSGLEGYEDGGQVFTNAAAHFKTQYGVTVEPTLSGMESLLTQLSAGLSKLDGMEAVSGILTSLHIGAESLRSEYVVAGNKVGGDIRIIEGMISNQRDGIDGMEDGGAHFNHMASSIKESYGIEIEPTLSGMESFLGKLKEAFKTLTSKKRKPIESVIEGIYDLKKGLETLKGNVESRGVKEGEGTVTLSVPKSYGKNITAESIAKVSEDTAKKQGAVLNKLAPPTKATLVNGLKVFNKYAKHAVPKTEEEFSKLVKNDFPIKPGFPDYEWFPHKKVEYIAADVKLLDKAGIDKAIATLTAILEQFEKFSKIVDDVDNGALDHSEIAESDFWNEYWETDEVEQLCDAIYFQSVTDNLYNVVWGWANEVEPGIKVLEQWINASIK